MAPKTRRLKVLDDNDDVVDEDLLNHTAEDKREVRNNIEELMTRLEEYRKKREAKTLLNDDGFKDLLRDSKNMINKIHNTQEFLEDARLFKKLCRIVQESSADMDGNTQKFSTQMYTTSLLTNLGVVIPEGSEKPKMTTSAFVNFGKFWSPAFNHAPTYQFVLGTLNNESEGGTGTRKRVIKRPASQKAKEKGATKIANIGKNQTVEAMTDRYVKLTRKCLEDNYAKNKKQPLCYFSFVIDPDSFGKTVENMFHVSFLVRQRWATLAIGENGMPTIEPYFGEDFDSDEEGDGIGSGIDQAVIDICQADWMELKTNLKIKTRIIDIPDR